jgi:hypothetical protein
MPFNAIRITGVVRERLDVGPRALGSALVGSHSPSLRPVERRVVAIGRFLYVGGIPIKRGKNVALIYRKP